MSAKPLTNAQRALLINVPVAERHSTVVERISTDRFPYVGWLGLKRRGLAEIVSVYPEATEFRLTARGCATADRLIASRKEGQS